MRTTAPSMLLALGLSVVSLGILGKLVFVAQVWRNMPAIQDIGAVLTFVVAAFAHTDFVVQALTALTVIGGIMLLRDALRTARFMRVA